MNRKNIILLLLCLAVVLVAALGYGIYYMCTSGMENDMASTNSAGYAVAEIPHADSLIVGKWQHSANPQWYKVYYDDYDEDTHKFWGKEWDEAEDLFEEDLTYHGNGWFRWEKKGALLLEYATMDSRDVPIRQEYKLLLSSHDTLVYCEKDYKHIVFHFSRVSLSYQ